MTPRAPSATTEDVAGGRLAALREHYDTTDQSDAIDRAEREDDVDPNPMVTTSLRMPKSLLDWVREQAETERIKPTTLLRRWVEERREAYEGHGDLAARLAALEQRIAELDAEVARLARDRPTDR